MHSPMASAASSSAFSFSLVSNVLIFLSISNSSLNTITVCSRSNSSCSFSSSTSSFSANSDRISSNSRILPLPLLRALRRRSSSSSKSFFAASSVNSSDANGTLDVCCCCSEEGGGGGGGDEGGAAPAPAPSSLLVGKEDTNSPFDGSCVGGGDADSGPIEIAPLLERGISVYAWGGGVVSGMGSSARAIAAQKTKQVRTKGKCYTD